MKVFIIVALLLTGCAGKYLRLDNENKLHNGMTVGEVTEMLNNPRVTPIGNNAFLFSYDHVNLAGRFPKTLQISFDDQGLSTGLNK